MLEWARAWWRGDVDLFDVEPRAVAEAYVYEPTLVEAWARVLQPVAFVGWFAFVIGWGFLQLGWWMLLLGVPSFLTLMVTTSPLNRAAYRWRYWRPYRWWHPTDGMRATRAYRDFRVRFPVSAAWAAIRDHRHPPGPISR